MKRKSCQVPSKSMYEQIRKQRKHNTYSFNNSNKNDYIRNNKCYADIIASSISEQILEKTLQIVSAHQKQKFLSEFIHNIYQQYIAISMSLNPNNERKHIEQNKQQMIDKIPQKQPQRINYDPLCGFDKLITRKNDNQKLIQETPLNSTITNMENKLTKIKIKQSMDSSFDKSNAFPKLKKQNNLNSTLLKRTYSKQNLIPLGLQLSSLGDKTQSDKKQAYLRGRYFQNINILPIPSFPSRNTSKISSKVLTVDQISARSNRKIFMANTQKSNFLLNALPNAHQINEDYIYDYDGQKIYQIHNRTYGISSNKNSKGNVLKTSYQTLDKSLINNLEGKQLNKDSLKNRKTQRQIIIPKKSQFLQNIQNIKSDSKSNQAQTQRLSSLNINNSINQKTSHTNIALRQSLLRKRQSKITNTTKSNFQKTFALLKNSTIIPNDQLLNSVIENKMRDNGLPYKIIQHAEQKSDENCGNKDNNKRVSTIQALNRTNEFSSKENKNYLQNNQKNYIST